MSERAQEKWAMRNRALPEMVDALKAVDALGKWWNNEGGDADKWDRYQRFMEVVGLARAALTKAGE